jgi:hypothetical protein
MTDASALQNSRVGLPDALTAAQAAIHLPEVPDMLRKLAAYNLGVFMPHRHQEMTGELQVLPDSVVQVESGLDITFRSVDELGNQTGRFLPVGWFWRRGAATPVSVCEMIEDESLSENTRSIKHKMVREKRDNHHSFWQSQ